MVEGDLEDGFIVNHTFEAEVDDGLVDDEGTSDDGSVRDDGATDGDDNDDDVLVEGGRSVDS